VSAESLVTLVEQSRVAVAVAQSVWLTGLLSGVHLLGMTMLTGGALVSGLRLCGVLLRERPVAEVADGVVRAVPVGLLLSVASGGLLVASRLSGALATGTFRIKMGLLLLAVAFHVACYRRVALAGTTGSAWRVVVGACNVVLWLGVALAGAAFILLE